jgi:hypothetical protein
MPVFLTPDRLAKSTHRLIPREGHEVMAVYVFHFTEGGETHILWSRPKRPEEARATPAEGSVVRLNTVSVSTVGGTLGRAAPVRFGAKPAASRRAQTGSAPSHAALRAMTSAR